MCGLGHYMDVGCSDLIAKGKVQTPVHLSFLDLVLERAHDSC
jgi:hypothetical protein